MYSAQVVRHADAAALDRLEPMLVELRSMPELKEVRRGVFYRRSKAFIHFHDDAAGLYADVRLGEDFERHRVETQDERRHVIGEIHTALSK
jgi:hypothetical protein